MAGGDRIQYIRFQHRVIFNPPHLDVVISQHIHVIFHVLTHLALLCIFQQWFQLIEHPVTLQLFRRTRIIMADRNIDRLILLYRKRHPDDLRLHIIQIVSFSIKGEYICRL